MLLDVRCPKEAKAGGGNGELQAVGATLAGAKTRCKLGGRVVGGVGGG